MSFSTLPLIVSLYIPLVYRYSWLSIICIYCKGNSLKDTTNTLRIAKICLEDRQREYEAEGCRGCCVIGRVSVSLS
jgi:hypothetical protein